MSDVTEIQIGDSIIDCSTFKGYREVRKHLYRQGYFLVLVIASEQVGSELER